MLSLVLLPPPLLQPNGIPSRSGIMKEIYDLLILALLWRIVLRFNGEALPAVVIDNKLYLNTTYGIGIAYNFTAGLKKDDPGGHDWMEDCAAGV